MVAVKNGAVDTRNLYDLYSLGPRYMVRCFLPVHQERKVRSDVIFNTPIASLVLFPLLNPN